MHLDKGLFTTAIVSLLHAALLHYSCAMLQVGRPSLVGGIWGFQTIINQIQLVKYYKVDTFLNPKLNPELQIAAASSLITHQLVASPWFGVLRVLQAAPQTLKP